MTDHLLPPMDNRGFDPATATEKERQQALLSYVETAARTYNEYLEDNGADKVSLIMVAPHQDGTDAAIVSNVHSMDDVRTALRLCFNPAIELEDSRSDHG